ncbi:MAG: GAF domain-containing protein [Anaerolineales bacterium]|nr:GAF domain-containing protein [Anaerolineales bacterium]
MNLDQTLPAPRKKFALFQSGSLRAHLLISALTWVLIPILIIGGVAAWLSSQALQERAFDQLESVAELKNNEIEVWVNTMQIRLSLAAVNPDFSNTLSAIAVDPVGQTESLAPARAVLNRYLDETFAFSEVFLMDANGRVVLSTEKSQEGKILKNQNYFHEALSEPYTTPPFYDLAQQAYSVVFSRPLKNSAGKVVGVLSARTPMTVLSEIMEQRAGLGDTGETYLVNSNNAVLTALRFKETDEQTYVSTEGINAAIQTKTEGSATYVGYHGDTVLAVYHWIPELQIVAVAAQDQAETLASVRNLIFTIIILSVITLLIASLIAFLSTQSITGPISKLAEAAQYISQGHLDREVDVPQVQELGVLARSFNAMVAQLRDLIGGLEQRVTARTKDLSTVAEIATAASTVLDINPLLQQVTDLVKERFNLYHAHLYLLDDAGETLTLTSGAGEVGRQMVSEKRSIPLNQERSLVARAARDKKGVTVNDVTQNPDFLPHPLLPNTRSELAVPMLIGENVIGVLDVQADSVGRFTDSDVDIQTTLASQVASAIQNARSYTDVQRSNESAQAILTSIGIPMTISRLTDGVMVFANEPALSLTNMTHEELIGHVSPDFYYEAKDRDTLVGELRSKGYVSNMNLRIKGEDGKPVWTVVSSRMFNYQGAPSVIASFVDVTENIKTQELVAKQAQELESVAEIGTVAAQEPDVQKMLETVVHLTQRRFGLYHAHVFLFNEDMQDLEIIACGWKEGDEREGTHGTRAIPIGQEQSLVARAARSRQAVVVNDVHSDPDWLPNELLPDTASELAVPMIVGNRLIGVLDVQSDKLSAFGEQEIAIQMTLAAQVATAVQNARSFEQAQSALTHTEKLFESGSNLTETNDLQELMALVVESINIPAADRATLGAIYYGADGEPETMEIIANWQKSDALPVSPLGTRFPKPVLKAVSLSKDNPSPIFYSDITTDPRVDAVLVGVAKQANFRSIASIPLFSGGRPEAFVMVESKDVHQFTPEEIRLITELSPQISAVVQNARSFQRAQSALAQTERLFNASSRLTETNDLTALMALIVESLNIPALDRAVLSNVSYDADNIPETLEILANWQKREDLLVPPVGAIFTKEALASLSMGVDPTFYNDIQNDPRADEGFKAVSKQTNFRAVATLPLFSGGRAETYLSLEGEHPHEFTEEEIQLIIALAPQMSAVVQNRLQFERAQSALAQTERLYQASNRLTQAKDLQELTAAAVETVHIPVVNRVILASFNYDADNQINSMDILANWWSGSGRQATPPGTRYPIEIVRAMSLFMSATPVFFNNTLTDPRVDAASVPLAKQQDIHALAVLPLYSGAQQIGALLLEAEEPYDFTEDDIRLLTALAPQIATVLENRRQFERTQKQAQRETMLNAINQKIQSATSVEAVLQIAARELGHALGAPMTVAQLSLKDGNS